MSTFPASAVNAGQACPEGAVPGEPVAAKLCHHVTTSLAIFSSTENSNSSTLNTCRCK